MYWKATRLYSASNSKTPHQSSFADRQNGCAKIVPDFLYCIYSFHDQDFISKVCLYYCIFHHRDLPRMQSPKPFLQGEHSYFVSIFHIIELWDIFLAPGFLWFVTRSAMTGLITSLQVASSRYVMMSR